MSIREIGEWLEERGLDIIELKWVAGSRGSGHGHWEARAYLTGSPL